MKTDLLIVSLLLVTVSCSPPLPKSQPAPTPTSTAAPTLLPQTAVPPTPTLIPPSATPVPYIIPLPPQGYLYQGVYPGGTRGVDRNVTLPDLRSYEGTVGKTAAWVYFEDNWYRTRRFPLKTASWIRAAGSVPFIRLILQSGPEQYQADPTFTLQNIIDGKFDENLLSWCASARDFGTPILAEYGTEVNGNWFSWNGEWNGAGTTNAYGDPTQPDGPERFKDAYRHIIQVCRDQGARNIVWVFHVDDGDYPDESWNRFENYYPGDEWIDWIGVSIYSAQTPQSSYWVSFRTEMDSVYPRLAALTPDKPIVLLEFGVTGNNPLGDQAQWARAALDDITSFRYPRLIGFSWWNEWWENDNKPKHDTNMRVQDNPALASAFRELVGANPMVLGRIVP